MPPRYLSLLRWSLAYGLGGFALGFVFGALRELVLIPQLGLTGGRWAEFPLVTLSIAALGVWIGRRARPPALAIGLLGVAVLVVAESFLAVVVLRQPIEAYAAQYNVLRGALFPYGLAVMGLAPLLGRRLP